MKKDNQPEISATRILLILILSIFFVELLIMVAFFNLPPLPAVAGTFTDATVLILLVSPIVYRFAVVPLTKQTAKTREAAAQLEALNLDLEKRVADRTQELEVINEEIKHRATQFESIASVARIISSTQDIETLLPQISEAISDQFGFYHVGIFLLDTTREHAVLAAANSAGGKKMLDRNHRLNVGGAGIVGYVTGSGKPRVALDVGQDAAFFNNPDLPETHSEIALPLQSVGEPFGALDVQSTHVNAFSQEDVSILSALADQVSIAILNARSLQQVREALAQLEAASAQMTKHQWQEFLEQQSVNGYTFDGVHTRKISPSGSQPANGLAIPLTIRGVQVGVLKLGAATSQDRQWSEDEIAVAQATAERTAIALENARLILEAQRQAIKEQTISEVTGKIGASINMKNVLQTAVEELGRAIPGAEVTINFQNGTADKGRQ